VLKFGHQNLSTYGIGRDLTRDQWMLVARQLVQKELLIQNEFGSLRLSEKAYEALKNREPIMGILEKRQPTSQADKPAHDRDLFEILRTRRKELADKAGVPPYAIFPDRTLSEMATYFPLSLESLKGINGVGTVKLQRYGKIFLDLIQAYCTHRGIVEKPKTGGGGNGRSATQSAEAKLPDATRLRHTVVGEAYNTGKSFYELVEQYGVKASTILDHLTKYALEGQALRPAEDVRQLSRLSEMAQQTVLSAIAAEGADTLRPIYDRLNGAITYDEIKILRLYYLSTKQIAR
jgi:ATP-dependent DNA helicase RecQ